MDPAALQELFALEVVFAAALTWAEQASRATRSRIEVRALQEAPEGAPS
ncbi:hypothetical protein ACQBAU_11765 [Propionibacteriaceae bacterium Y2011]